MILIWIIGVFMGLMLGAMYWYPYKEKADARAREQAEKKKNVS